MTAPDARPPRADDWRPLARYAAWIHVERMRTMPLHLSAGKVDEAEAARQLRVTAAIAADWRFAVTLAGAPSGDDPDAGGATPWEKRGELSDIAAAARRLADQHPGNRELVGQAEAAELLLWHARQPHGPVWYATTTLAARAMIARDRAEQRAA